MMPKSSPKKKKIQCASYDLRIGLKIRLLDLEVGLDGSNRWGFSKSAQNKRGNNKQYSYMRTMVKSVRRNDEAHIKEGSKEDEREGVQLRRACAVNSDQNKPCGLRLIVEQHENARNRNNKIIRQSCQGEHFMSLLGSFLYLCCRIKRLDTIQYAWF